MARVFDEKFEATGYDESGWSETVAAGNTCDEDFATSSVIGAPGYWDDDCLKCVNGGATAHAYALNATLTEPDSWTRIEFIWDALPSNTQNFISLYDVTNSKILVYFQVLNASGDLRCFSYHDGSSNTYDALTTLSADTLHRIEVKWDVTNNVWAWRLDGVDQPNDVDASDPITSEGTLSSTHATNLERIICGTFTQNRGVTVYFDNVAVDDADWVGPDRVFDEQFEATGYDEAGWSEVVAGGNTVDEDFATSSVTGAPGNWDDLCLECTNGGSGNNAHNTNGTLSEADSWTRIEFITPALPFADQNFFNLYDLNDSKTLFQLRMQNSGNLRMYVWHDGSSNTYDSLTNCSADTLYRVECKWDTTNDVWAWRIDGVDQPNNVDGSDPVESEGTLSSTHASNLERILLGHHSQNTGLTVYFDNVAVDKTGWVGAEREVESGSTGTGVLEAAAAETVGAGVALSTGTGALAAGAAATVGEGVGGDAATGTGTLEAAAAETVGAGVALSTGSGTLEAAAAETVGAGVAVSVGTGTLEAAAAETVGAGVAVSTGAGTLEAAAAAVAGAGVALSTGTGVLASGASATAGAGVSLSSGAGTLEAAVAAIAGAGVAVSTGTSTLAAAAAEIAGAGVALSTGTGVLEAAAAEIVGGDAVAAAAVTASMGDVFTSTLTSSRHTSTLAGSRYTTSITDSDSESV